MTHWKEITLIVPVEDEEESPELWDWNALLDTPLTVVVSDMAEKELEECDRVSDLHGNYIEL